MPLLNQPELSTLNKFVPLMFVVTWRSLSVYCRIVKILEGQHINEGTPKYSTSMRYSPPLNEKEMIKSPFG